MDLASRIRRSLFRDSRRTQRNPDIRNASKLQQSIGKDEVDEELLGVTEELIENVRSFTVDTFKSFPLEDEQATSSSYEEESNATSSSANMRKDLSDWQERHAILVLSKSKELSQLRFKLCPRSLKERQFWSIYFKLVRNLVAEYELRAIQQAKIRRMPTEDGQASKTGALYEVEMAETRQDMSFKQST